MPAVIKLGRRIPGMYFEKRATKPWGGPLGSDSNHSQWATRVAMATASARVPGPKSAPRPSIKAIVYGGRRPIFSRDDLRSSTRSAPGWFLGRWRSIAIHCVSDDRNKALMTPSARAV